MHYQKEEPSYFSHSPSPVEVYTEWDPLEEVIVGIMDDIRVPDWDKSLKAIIPEENHDFFQTYSGKRFPEELLIKARQEVETLAQILQAEGIRVKRPNDPNHHQPIMTPHFTTGGTFYSAMPRDCLFAIGKKIIEVPMSWRSRYFETFAFRDILNDYFTRGAEWIAAPKPMLSDDVWEKDFDFEQEFPFRSIITEVEPLFDAADFMKMGRDIIGQRSHATNKKGIEWLRRTL
ncbi:amidinotransferase, partial [Erwinia amylovora]